MSGYLQRLYDRGAGLTAARPSVPAGDVAPAMAPASPAVAFDQRLAEPRLAQDFAIPGVSPDTEALVEGEPPEEPAPPLAPPRESAAPVEPIAPSTGWGAVRAESPSVLPRRSVDSVPDSDPASRTVKDVLPPPAGSEALEPPAARPARPVPPVEPRPVRAPAPVSIEHRESDPEPPAQGANASSATAAPRSRADEPLPVVFPHPPQNGRTSIPQPQTVAQPEPLQPTPPPERWPWRQPTREVEPLRRAPAPLEPPPAAAADARDVERIARETVRAELARRPEVGHGADERRGATTGKDRDGTQKPAPRPASAREASVIGELEPSSSPLTIYGLRRR